MAHSAFDSKFYQRFYLSPRTRVTTAAEMRRRATTVATIAKQLQLPVRRILDAGCGLGWMRPALVEAFPRSTYVGLEVSEHLCRLHGWTHASLATYRSRARFDLIICYDVMQYLPQREAARAMSNLGRLCRGALYFHAATVEDWQYNADRSSSDDNVHLRDADWYRARLARQFRYLGLGVHLQRDVPLCQWELEKPNGSEKPRRI
jgi:SAM-dependent methyltransferase